VQFFMPRVIHFEIHAADPQRLIRFYGELLGWAFEPSGPPGGYWLIRTGTPGTPGIDGGLLPRRGAAPAPGQAVNSFVCTVDVASATQTLDKVAQLGGAIAMPVIPVPGVGWLGYGRDPDGNILGFMQRDPAAR
jgi:predicted enzyme related to lactoylglutathione lyase